MIGGVNTNHERAMNTNTTSHTSARQRFIQNLAESDLFQHYQKAFHTLTSLPLNLESVSEDIHIDQITTRTGVAGVVETQVPVRVGKNTIAIMLRALESRACIAFNGRTLFSLPCINYACMTKRRSASSPYNDCAWW